MGGKKPVSGDIAVKIHRPYGVEVKRDWLKRIMAETLATENSFNTEVSLVVTSDSQIQELNRTYRQVDAPTDVLAFALTEETGESFVSPPDSLLHLGEIAISYPRAVQQAKEKAHSTQEEMALLTIHGMLHLLGYDHGMPGPTRKMRARERAIMAYLREKQLC